MKFDEWVYQGHISMSLVGLKNVFLIVVLGKNRKKMQFLINCSNYLIKGLENILINEVDRRTK